MNRILFEDQLRAKLPDDKQLQRILESTDSEDLLTWNVFWPLTKVVPPERWTLPLLKSALGREVSADLVKGLELKLWHGRRGKEYYPPRDHDDWLRQRLLKSGIDYLEKRANASARLEGPTEVDIVLESDQALVFIEAKYLSDISADTSYDTTRDQIARNIDVGTYQAKNRDFYFILLTPDYFERSRLFWYKMQDYRSDAANLARALPHRVGGSAPVDFERMRRNIGWLLWRDVIPLWKSLLDESFSGKGIGCDAALIADIYRDFVSKGLITPS
jgi:hypothetical protein